MTPPHASQLQADYQRIVKEALPSVVQIDTPRGQGSGIVYDKEGHIVTNAHVVSGSRTFKVMLADAEEPLDASLVGSHTPEDLAVIRLDNPPSELRPAAFADSSKTAVGQIVLAMGNPLGLSGSVTQGIVSATGRTVTGPPTADRPGATIPNMVQTSAAINPGNSGGPLVNLAAKVIGVNTLAATEAGADRDAYPGIGFAVPGSTVTRITRQLIEKGRVVDSGRASLGAAVRTVLGPRFEPVGAGVVRVEANGPAHTAGIRAGDVITRLDDTKITTVADLAETLAGDHRPGDRVRIGYTRDGRSHAADVVLGTLGS
ncbi:S1C family serine protease [Streptomyces halobius]|uniref:Trypsin-like peptidase domain-containing protein n=1 Tax=Streptomyces halobius TaxID=2879846 RepID=A0ABY4M492_9ACTN|nr:trypsin-like peptidase domain-containing protein [Streptomyces halobius]UQA92008.1 trypsin-like peptidase domain-containing protein [Streptomyces halobius]